eukprot:2287459-Amphidinium_carterae.1
MPDSTTDVAPKGAASHSTGLAITFQGCLHSYAYHLCQSVWPRTIHTAHTTGRDGQMSPSRSSAEGLLPVPHNHALANPRFDSFFDYLYYIQSQIGVDRKWLAVLDCAAVCAPQHFAAEHEADIHCKRHHCLVSAIRCQQRATIQASVGSGQEVSCSCCLFFFPCGSVLELSALSALPGQAVPATTQELC